MRKILLLLTATSFLVTQKMHAQKKIDASPINKNAAASLSRVFKNYSLFSLDAKALALQGKKSDKNKLDVELTFPGITSMHLLLEENNILSTKYKLTVGNAQGKQVFPRTSCKTYSGKLADDATSSVSLTLSDNSVFGIVRGKGKEYFIEPLKNFSKQAAEGTFVLYEIKDVIPSTNNTCGAIEATQRLNEATLSLSQLARTTVTCKSVEMAIASDHLMFDRYETVQAVEEHTIGVLNAMIGIFNNTQIGSSYYTFKLNGQYVSTTYESDPLLENYSGDVYLTLLERFESWGEAGGFEFSYDIGEFWTARVMSDFVSGVARQNGACTSQKYHVISDIFTGGFLTALVAHETGHSLGAGHDNLTYSIMSPQFDFIRVPASFSSTSISQMNNFMSQATCFDVCENEAPVARFTSSFSPFTNGGYCVGSTVTFTDASFGEVDQVAWTFQDGTPATSTSEIQNVVFSSAGVKTVTLTASNAHGSTSITKNITIGYVGTADQLEASAAEVCPFTPYTVSFPAAPTGAILQKYDPQLNNFITIGPIGETPIQFISGDHYLVNHNDHYTISSDFYRALWLYGDALPGCMAISQLNIVIVKGAKPVISGVNSICPGNPIQLEVSDTSENPVPYASYLWSPGGATTPAININPSTSGLYSVTVTNENGCSSTATKNVIVGTGALGLTTTEINCNTATFNWTSAFNPSSWELEYKSTVQGSKWINVPVPNVSTRSVTINNLKLNQNYQWHIRAKCGRSTTSYSDLVLFKTLASCNTISGQVKTVRDEKLIPEITELLKVVVMSNPSSTNFRIALTASDTKEPVKILVTDVTGRVVETRIATVGQIITLGDKYRSGTYLVRLIQGKETRQIKLVKISD